MVVKHPHLTQREERSVNAMATVISVAFVALIMLVLALLGGASIQLFKFVGGL